MLSPADLLPGDLMFGPIHGAAGNLIVGPGQIALAPWKNQLTWRTWWKIRHVAVVVAGSTPDSVFPLGGSAMGFASGGGPRIVQAMPSRAEEVELGSDHWTPEYVYIRPRYAPGQAARVAVEAQDMARARIPYNWLDYLAIAQHRMHLPSPLLDRYVGAMDGHGYPARAICSQLADAALTMAGFHPFDDGRKPGDVTPADLYLRLLELDPALVIKPGVLLASTSANGGGLHPSTRRALL